jgi:CheY-like chemotaxis protein
MALNGPIILVEDDKNDADVISLAIKEIGVTNEVIILHTAQEAYDFLLTTTERPFFILCDIRMPYVDGLSFRKNIFENEELRKKSIPFIFFTGLVSQDIVNEAYNLEVQGFFEKATSYDAIKEQLLILCLYWKQSLHPNIKFPV